MKDKRQKNQREDGSIADPDEVLRRLLNTPPDKKRKAVKKKKPKG